MEKKSGLGRPAQDRDGRDLDLQVKEEMRQWGATIRRLGLGDCFCDCPDPGDCSCSA